MRSFSLRRQTAELLVKRSAAAVLGVLVLGLVRTMPSRENCERTHNLMGCATSKEHAAENFKLLAGWPG